MESREPRTYLLVSATQEESAHLESAGPRRDYLELALATGGELCFVEGDRRRAGLVGRLLGAHVRQAWKAAGTLRDGDRVFADGEHNGLPLVLFLRLRGRRNVHTVMLGHLLSSSWKQRALRLASMLGAPATIIVHSVLQQAIASRAVASRWSVHLVPYQVDTAFWTPPEVSSAPVRDRPLFVAAGSENRDYTTLVEAARDTPGVDVVIAAGSHWAREIASAESEELPANVTFLRDPLGFAELRDLYHQAAAVVVPLREVDNQSGVTTILEAMSVGIPVVVSATRGQQECVAGPLVSADGTLDWDATAMRGPANFRGDSAATPPAAIPSGIYVAPGDAAGLAAALSMIATGRAPEFHPDAIRAVACTQFSVGAYVRRLAQELHEGSADSTPASLQEEQATASGHQHRAG